MSNSNNQVAWITGGSSGFGPAPAVRAVEGPNDDSEGGADLLLSVLTDPTGRYWHTVGWNAARIGLADLDDIDHFQVQLVGYYQMDGRPALDSAARR